MDVHERNALLSAPEARCGGCPLHIGTTGGLWGGEDCDAVEHRDPKGK